MLLKPNIVITVIALLTYLALSAGCARSPYQIQLKLAESARLKPIEIETATYQLRAFVSENLVRPTKTLHVYLEGDGVPWADGRTPSENPNSRDLLALRLMLRDTSPSIYLNRPCYGFSEVPSRCDKVNWTQGRFSLAVIEAISAALDKVKHKYGIEDFWLIGHSGGGAIAALLAEKRNDVAVVVTVAGNLNHASWTKHHGYLPLDQSLNPVEVFPLDQTTSRWHFVAGKDETIPSPLLLKAARKDIGANIVLGKNFDHHCCWQKKWHEILADIQQEIN